MKADRVPYIEAGGAWRAAVTAAVTAELTPRELRVLLAVSTFTVSYSRLGDEISLARLAHAAGMPYGSGPKKVAVALRRLVDAGVLVYRPGGGRHRVGFVGLPKGGPAAGPFTEEKGDPAPGPLAAKGGPPPGPVSGPKGDPAPDRKGTRSRTEKGPGVGPLPEKTPEKPLRGAPSANGPVPRSPKPGTRAETESNKGNTFDPLVERLVVACTGADVDEEAASVVAHLRSYVDDVVIDMHIAELLRMPKRPLWPRFLVGVVRSWGEDNGIDVPDLERSGR